MHETDLRGIDLGLLALFEALLDTRSVTRAGDRVDLSQPAASRALARLRALLHDPLFVRGPDGLVPTRRALALRAPLAAALGAVRALVAPPVFDPASATGTARILAPDFDAAALVPPLLAAFGTAAPGLDVALLPRRGDALVALAADDADLAVGVYANAPAGFRRQRLYDDTMVCVLRRGHPALARPLTAARFAALDHALITVTGEGGGVVDTALAQRGLVRRILLRVPSFLAAPLVVARSDLVVTMPRRIATEFAAIAPLVLVEPPLPIPRFTVSQVWHERQHADPRHAFVRTTLAAVAAANVRTGGRRAP
ncbi:MAG: LysR family transcriptional regulator [Betaproteobacteria bacterium]|nr:LysR family transcriptional regulator [Betaproteobacteria bacterium]